MKIKGVSSKGMDFEEKEIKDQMLSRQAAVKVDQLPYKWSPYSIDFINKVPSPQYCCFSGMQTKD